MSAVERIEPQLPARSTATTLLAEIIKGGAALEVVREMKATIEWQEGREARREFDHAIAAAKADIPVIIKNATGHNSKKYADFAAIARAVDPILSRHGLSYRFRTVQDDKSIRVTCVLSHDAGHSEDNTLAGPADTSGNKNAIQSIGSTLTYLQRYSLVQALGLAAAEDDDGKAGGNGKAITDEEVTTIRDILKAINDASVEPRLLKYLKVANIEAIPADRYDDTIENLKKVKRS